jgi:hypothetical protein
LIKSLSAAVAVGVLFLAGPASAAGIMTATLDKPVAKASGEIISGVMWRCLGTACATTSDAASADPKTTCRKVVKQWGKVSAFSSARGAMSASDLEACNS